MSVVSAWWASMEDTAMEGSWGYIWEKAHDLLRAVFLLNGSLVSRLKQVESSELMYLFVLTPPDPELKEQFEEMARRWTEDVRPELNELQVSGFGRDLLSLIWKIDQRYLEEKSKSR